MLIDSHCHLNYLDDPLAALRASQERGVDKLLCIGVDQERIHEVLELARSQQGVFASVGEHPGNHDPNPDWVEQHLQAAGVVAVGETGLDYLQTADVQQHAMQRESFDTHLSLAEDHDLPVVIHTRSAENDTLDIIRAHPGVQGVLHCFTESWEMAKDALDLGFYVSISGIVTFKNAANVRDVAREIPDDRLLIETDSPWLAPVPHRGKTNEPAFVYDTAEFLADLRNVSLAKLADLTSANCQRLFGI